MTNNDILSQLNTIFIETLENKNIILTNESTAEDIYEWDSITHIYLFVEIENLFNIHFTAAEIRNLKNIGELIQCIESKNEKQSLN